jgi:hypothetical protein
LKPHVVVWNLWIERNGEIFKDNVSLNNKLGCMIMDGIVAYGKLEWERIL